MLCQIAGLGVTLRMGIDEGTTDTMPGMVMANTKGFFNFLRETAVRPVTDNHLIVLLDRHLFCYLQKQTAFGLVGDNATPGSCPWR